MWTVEQHAIEPRGMVYVARPLPDESTRLTGMDRWQSLDHLVAAHPGGGWVVEVQQETLLTSTALAALAGILRRLQVAGGRLVFVGTQPGVSNVLRSMRLSRMIVMAPDIAAGIAEATRALAAPMGSATT